MLHKSNALWQKILDFGFQDVLDLNFIESLTLCMIRIQQNLSNMRLEFFSSTMISRVYNHLIQSLKSLPVDEKVKENKLILNFIEKILTRSFFIFILHNVLSLSKKTLIQGLSRLDGKKTLYQWYNIYIRFPFTAVTSMSENFLLFLHVQWWIQYVLHLCYAILGPTTL